MLQTLLPIITPILGDVLKKVIPDTDRHREIEREIKLALLDHTDSLERMRGEIVLAEAKSNNWLTAAWRPMLMMVIILIVAMNYLVFPIAGILTGTVHSIFLPDQLWDLLTIGVGGYVVGRSGEKMVDKWRK